MHIRLWRWGKNKNMNKKNMTRIAKPIFQKNQNKKKLMKKVVLRDGEIR